MNHVIDTRHTNEYIVGMRKRAHSLSLVSIGRARCQRGVMQEQSGRGRTNGVPVPQLTLLRKHAGFSQRALAERAKVSRQTINRLEQGANARYDTIKRLAQALKVTPARLVRPARQRSTQVCPSSLESQG